MFLVFEIKHVNCILYTYRQMDKSLKINIFGASGAGTTTLGRTLAKYFDYPYYNLRNQLFAASK